MKTQKHGNLIRPVALFLVAIAIIGTIGFAASGWQSATNPEDNSGDVDKNNDNADNDKNNIKPDNTPQEPEIYIPKYVSYLTGLEITESENFSKPICFAVNPKNPLYGISSAEMLIEIPTENGETRILAYMNSQKLPGKIGTISPTRKYIDNIIKYFGGVMVSHGNDDTVEYTGPDIGTSKFDLTEKTGYHYTEYTHYVYTNGDLITAGIINSGIASYSGKKDNMPYQFLPFGESDILGTQAATSITIPYSDGNSTELIYSKANEKYSLSKNTEIKKDLLNDKPVEYDNAFVLFADATTYETAKASEMVLDTVSGGMGMYISKGTFTEIEWSTDSNGNLIFTDKEGAPLVINRGTTYISYMKSSKTNDIIIK